MTRELIQLPNKDLWRGYNPDDASANIDVEVVPETAQNPVNRAMAAILRKAQNGVLTCIWCGLQGDERYMRQHVKESHKSVIEPSTASEAALATLATQQKAQLESAAAASV